MEQLRFKGNCCDDLTWSQPNDSWDVVAAILYTYGETLR